MINLNESLVLRSVDGEQHVECVHCGHVISTSQDYRDALAFYEGENTEAGPQMWPRPSDYVDAPIVFRQYYCPSCFVALRTEVVPVDHPNLVDEVRGVVSEDG